MYKLWGMEQLFDFNGLVTWMVDKGVNREQAISIVKQAGNKRSPAPTFQKKKIFKLY